MKVYSKNQCEARIHSITQQMKNSIIDICIDTVKEKLQHMVLIKENYEIKKLTERIETLEIDLLSKYNLIKAPKPINNKQRKSVVKKLHERMNEKN